MAQKFEGARYNPKRFPAVILRKTSPAKGTILLYSSGKAIIIGTSSEKETELLARVTGKDLKKLLGKTLVIKFSISNMIGRVNVGRKISISKAAEGFVGIKDDNFHGIVFRMNNSKKTALIFSSGRVVMNGCKSR